MNIRGADPKMAERVHQRQNAAREAQNAYQRKWRANNRERVKQYNADYWARKAEKAQEAI